ncbi:MAG TPA: LamG domain-containing protein, partial [Mycobacteriales bacterium]|nr:LamG domain-containing protein [Mycobacteriales bacterium]
MALAVLLVVLLFTTLLNRSGSGGGGTASPPGSSVGGGIPQRPSAPLPPTPKSEWDFDEGLGRNVADTAGGSPITLQGPPDWIDDGSGGTAAHFDGIRTYGVTNDPVLDTTRSFTVSAWVRLDKLPAGTATAVSQDAATDSAFSLQYADKHWVLTGSNPGTSGFARSIRSPSAGQWTLLTGVRDLSDGQLILYVDGTRQNAVSYGPRPVSTGPLAVGRGLLGGEPG